MNTLPLSWCRKNTEYSTYKTVKLPLSGMTWVSTADLPFGYTEEDIYHDLTAHNPDFVVRGLSHDTARYFSENGAQVLQTGTEADVDLDKSGLFKPSVLELAKRGGRHGTVGEVLYSKANEEKLERLISESSHGKEPKLHYLYREGFDKSVRCFVLKTPEDLWLGAVTISPRDGHCAHTESILRRKDAPVGVMEALFVSVMKTLRAEGYKHFSLGEVPFLDSGARLGISGSFKRALIMRSKQPLSRSFNYKGLYDFKNKFSPEWKPVYLAAKPKITLRLMLDLYLQSRYFDLSIFKLLVYLRAITPKYIKST